MCAGQTARPAHRTCSPRQLVVLQLVGRGKAAISHWYWTASAAGMHGSPGAAVPHCPAEAPAQPSAAACPAGRTHAACTAAAAAQLAVQPPAGAPTVPRQLRVYSTQAALQNVTTRAVEASHCACTQVASPRARHHYKPCHLVTKCPCHVTSFTLHQQRQVGTASAGSWQCAAGML